MKRKNNKEKQSGTTSVTKIARMENKEQQFNEQDAPLKNTDHAFVQVGKDGSSKLPEVDKKRSEEQVHDKKTTNSDKR